MKKWISILLCLIIIPAMTGCGDNNAAGKLGRNKPVGVNDVLEKGMAEADNKKADNSKPPAEYSTQNQQNTTSPVAKTSERPSELDAIFSSKDSVDEVDVDLTVLSGTMVYSEVYNMMASPEKYIGKTVKMKGPFAFYHDETTDNYYFACIIRDATACCAQGIEFILTADYVYPDDYPEVDEEICVVGVFDTYQEGNYTYCTLRNARLI